jgi:hypothetical protein
MRAFKTIFLTITVLLLLSACSNEVSSPAKQVHYNEEYISFTGRWSTLTDTGSFILIPKINTIDAYCERASMTCNESIALLYSPEEIDQKPVVSYSGASTGDGNLFVISQTYNIVDWTPKYIRATAETRVADIELIIWLSNETVEKRYRETQARGNEMSDPSIFRHWVLQ